MTLAPELDHGLEATAMLANSGVVAAVGHTDGGYDTASRAFKAGAKIGYVECEVRDEKGRLVAKASSTCLKLRGD